MKHLQVEQVPTGDGRWVELLASHPMARAIVPTWEVLAGWSNHNLGLFADGQLVGGLILSMQRIPYAAVALSRINCLMVDPSQHLKPQLDALMGAVERFSRKHLVLETELRLRLPVTPGIPGAEQNRALRSGLETHGYTPLTKVDTTYFVRIDRDDEALINSFDRSARNKIRKAQRSGVQVKLSHDYSLLDTFYAAYLDMCERKKAPVQPEALVGRGLKPLIEAGQALLFVETYPEGIGNMVITDALGVPCYVLGTRSPANVRGDVPGAAQVVQYEIMRFFRDRGHAWYDLGGCEGPVPVEGHHNFGVWRFKYGFLGEFVRFIPYMRRVRGPFQRVAHAAHVLRGDFI
ncbi:MAG: peptidoglycan bridge formation glycyltransferase FemA/FemB family protein [Myxococcales bacterium]|nr:peptidoglycan bridge formation glycyltransferase FemA/FemB family protein [Myxococcales bacterium]MCB9646263.1 peptidoglycan bridge formation glycyltransferase FemA/FemB family protein [Deltaproteobacteria bacterium]